MTQLEKALPSVQELCFGSRLRAKAVVLALTTAQASSAFTPPNRVSSDFCTNATNKCMKKTIPKTPDLMNSSSKLFPACLLLQEPNILGHSESQCRSYQWDSLTPFLLYAISKPCGKAS